MFDDIRLTFLPYNSDEIEDFCRDQSVCFYGRSSTVETDLSTGHEQETPASTSFYDSQAFQLPINQEEDTFRALLEHDA